MIAQKAWYKKQYDIDLSKEHIVYTPSITTSIAIENYTLEDDGIIIQPPVFMGFRDVIRRTKNSNVALNACHWFGREGILFMRMNITTSHKKVINAIKKVKAAANLV